jgi:hypothetical protein
MKQKSEEARQKLRKDRDTARLRYSILATGIGASLGNQDSHYYPEYSREILHELQTSLLPALEVWEDAELAYEPFRRMRHRRVYARPQTKSPKTKKVVVQ